MGAPSGSARNQLSDAESKRHRILEQTIALTKNEALDAKQGCGLERLLPSHTIGRIPCGFAVSQIDEEDAQTCGHQLHGGPTHRHFQVVGVGGKRDRVECHHGPFVVV